MFFFYSVDADHVEFTLAKLLVDNIQLYLRWIIIMKCPVKNKRCKQGI